MSEITPFKRDLYDIIKEDIDDQEGYAQVLNEVAETCHKTALEHGFWESDNFGEKIALIHSELSECLESKRKGDRQDDHLIDRHNCEVELADAVIRIFDLAIHEKFDLGGAILAKMRYNKQRPFKHNKQF